MNDQHKFTARYYWLNPSVDKDGIYRLHANYMHSNGVWLYNKTPPERLSLAERMAFDKGTQEDSKEYLTNKDRIDKEIAEIKATGFDYKYLGDTKPIAIGATAFFRMGASYKNPNATSTWDLLAKGGIKEDVKNALFQEYYQDQYQLAEEENCRKLSEEGKISIEELRDLFDRRHFANERHYREESNAFYNVTEDDIDKRAVLFMCEYVNEYLAWLRGKTDLYENTIGLQSKYDKAQLLEIAKRAVRKRLIMANETSNFLSLFGEHPGHIKWNDKIRGSKAALFNLMDRITGKIIQTKDLRTYVHTSSGNPVHDNWANKDRANVKMADDILNGI